MSKSNFLWSLTTDDGSVSYHRTQRDAETSAGPAAKASVKRNRGNVPRISRTDGQEWRSYPYCVIVIGAGYQTVKYFMVEADVARYVQRVNRDAEMHILWTTWQEQGGPKWRWLPPWDVEAARAAPKL